MNKQIALISWLILLPLLVKGQTEFADTLLDAYYSKANFFFNDFYGNDGPGCNEHLISPTVCLGDTPSFVALPTDSYVTVGFTDNIIFDAPGQNDIFILENGSGDEYADVFVSSDYGETFTYFGRVNGGKTSELDLADINFECIVNAIKIVGLDNKGCVPGFDLVKVYGIAGASLPVVTSIGTPPVLCADSGLYDLSALVEGEATGTWSGENVSGNSLNTDGVSGELTLYYVEDHPVASCPDDTTTVTVTVAQCDCMGVPDGPAQVDECGICLDSADPAFNQSCADCAGTPNGPAVVDECGVCLDPADPAFNQSCADCTGTPNGTAVLDECGVCLELTDLAFNQSCVDCAGTPNGAAVVDECGQCLDPSDPAFNQSCADCAGTPNGTAVADECGQCLDPSDPAFNQSCTDCAGTPNGAAVVDECGVCLDPADPAFNQSCLDCAGTPNGTAVVDECGVCLDPSDPAFNQSCADCAGVPNGTAIVDECGVCLDPVDPAFNGSCTDCAGVVNGSSVIDTCGVCLDPSDPGFNRSCRESPKLYIPNAFSPNGDGINDVFEIYSTDDAGLEIKTFLIFNRWGAIVYQAHNFSIDPAANWWDGSFKGERLDPGVFVYYIEVVLEDGTAQKYVGDTAIIK